MPPKKKHEQPDQPVLLGRLGTNLKCGIVGLPNVGCVCYLIILECYCLSAVLIHYFGFCYFFVMTVTRLQDILFGTDMYH